MASMSQKILARALVKLNEMEWPLSKIVIQKVLYFIKTQGLPVDWRFEPFTYGPFSFSLSSELTSMTYAERLEIEGNIYSINDIAGLELDQKTSDAVDRAIDGFARIVDGDHSFKTMELFGTVLYCKRALESSLGEVRSEDVIADFREWKEDRYTDQEIQGALERLQKSDSL